MRRKIMLAALLMAVTGMAHGQNTLSVEDFVMPQNGGSITVNLTLEEENVYTSYQFKVETPEGMEYITDESDDVECTLVSGHASSHSATSHWNSDERLLAVGVASMSSALFKGKTVSLEIPLAATEAAENSTFSFTVKGITFIKQTGTKDYLDDVTFTVTVGAPADTRTLLDENANAAPADAEGVDVRVRRTIQAAQWNTICLPFSMTAEQVTDVFGDDVLLKDFNGCETESDDNEDVVSITIKFVDAESIEANHPYLIWTSTGITEFTVNNVDIEVEENPSVDKDGVKVKKVWIYNSFVGNYSGNATVPENCLFVNGDKLYYSKGGSRLRGYRGYFDFYDVLKDLESANTRVTFSFGDIPTGVDVPKMVLKSDDRVYDLNGRQVSKAGNGVFITNSKKLLIK